MKKVTITPHDIITMLPFEKEFKIKLLARLEAADEDQKYEIENALWEAYDEMFEIVRDGHLDEQMQDAAEGRVPLNTDFYTTAVQKADDDMISMAYQGNTSDQLSSVREKLQGFLKE